MPKHDAFSPKAIANMIKAKGLQKLKWYCEMCEKQCRDENGFKCHKMSESHQRQMKLFSADASKYMNKFSREFEKGFIDIFSRQGGRRVKANDVYQEYIKDRHHVHMNATIWTTLTQFVYYLGKKGIAIVDTSGDTSESKSNETSKKELYIKYINRDYDYIHKKEKLNEINKEEEKQRKHEENEIKRLLRKQFTNNDNNDNNNNNNNNYHASNLERNDWSDKISFSLQKNQQKRCYSEMEEKERVKENDNATKKQRLIGNSNEDNIDKQKQIAKLRQKCLIVPNVVVKVLKGKFINKKAKVIGFDLDSNTTNLLIRVELLQDSKRSLLMNENDIQTVIPKFGSKVLILKHGKYHNQIGILQSIEQSKYRGIIQLDNNKLVKMKYDNFSKLFVE